MKTPNPMISNMTVMAHAANPAIQATVGEETDAKSKIAPEWKHVALLMQPASMPHVLWKIRATNACHHTMSESIHATNFLRLD